MKLTLAVTRIQVLIHLMFKASSEKFLANKGNGNLKLIFHIKTVFFTRNLSLIFFKHFGLMAKIKRLVFY